MQLTLTVEKLDSKFKLATEDLTLLNEAVTATKLAYAPYSKFLVGAAARLDNGVIVHGSNQENSSYPVCLCAERIVLASISSLYPNSWIDTLAISCINSNQESNIPASPCGMCRQALLEHELRAKHKMRIIMGGQTGEVWIVESANSLLPLAFSDKSMK